MDEGDLDVVGIGNAIVDVLSHAEEPLLEAHGLVKGSMTLIDARQADAIYADMGPAIEVSGGSVANSMAGLASLGARVGYIGKVRDDQFGRIFAHDIRASGVEFTTPPAPDAAPTARCMVLVTSDAHRTMATHLGACLELGPEDVDRDLIARGRVTYLEGYLWDPPRAKDALRRAMEVATAAGRTVALTLSDPFCVDRHRDEFRELVHGPVGVLFANETEIISLYQARDFEDALAQVRGRCEIAVLTRSEHGSVVVTDGEVHEVPAEPIAEVVDTTGAGDLFAAGFLHGLTRGAGLGRCAELGAIAAAEVISHWGARPEVSLSELVRHRIAG